MKFHALIVKQVRVKNAKDVLILLPKLSVAFIIAVEIYDGIRYFLSIIFSKNGVMGTLPFLSKLALFIFILNLLYGLVRWLKAKEGLKNTVMILAGISVISYFINGSVLGIYYVDGPYRGKVVDAETGEPIAGANVMGVWDFEFILFIRTDSTYADARETITDNKGRFFLPPGRRIWLWPFSWIHLKQLWVYKPGYDSHPPRMQLAWSDADKEKWKEKLLRMNAKYHHNLPADSNYSIMFKVIPKTIKIYYQTIIRLNKALSNKEQKEASSFGFGDIGYDRFKIKKFETAVKSRRIK